MRNARKWAAAAIVVVAGAAAGPAVADHPGSGTPDLGRSCSRATGPGLDSPAHEHCAPRARQFDAGPDIDGTATPLGGSGADAEVFVGAPLTAFADGGDHGLVLADYDANGRYTPGIEGDDFFAEGSVCATGVRDGSFTPGADCPVLDFNGSLTGPTAGGCDLGTGTGCVAPAPGSVSFYDADADGVWDDGEDIIIEGNGNGVFD